MMALLNWKIGDASSAIDGGKRSISGSSPTQTSELFVAQACSSCVMKLLIRSGSCDSCTRREAALLQMNEKNGNRRRRHARHARRLTHRGRPNLVELLSNLSRKAGDQRVVQLGGQRRLFVPPL